MQGDCVNAQFCLQANRQNTRLERLLEAKRSYDAAIAGIDSLLQAGVLPKSETDQQRAKGVCVRERAAHAVLDVFLSLSLPNRTCKSQTHIPPTSFQPHHFSLTPCLACQQPFHTPSPSHLNYCESPSIHPISHCRSLPPLPNHHARLAFARIICAACSRL